MTKLVELIYGTLHGGHDDTGRRGRKPRPWPEGEISDDSAGLVGKRTSRITSGWKHPQRENHEKKL